MVKIKGFTLIELMVVIAIIGILASMVLGPIRNMSAERYAQDAEEPVAGDNEMVVNGIIHICDANGKCSPK